MAFPRFHMQKQKNSEGRWGWGLAEVVGDAIFLRFWSVSDLAVRQHATIDLGASDDDLLIEGVPAKKYRALPFGALVR